MYNENGSPTTNLNPTTHQPIRPVRTNTRTYPYGTYQTEEHDMRTIWPAGDPITRDTETLVLFLRREPNPRYNP
jgi:hypothetical protein